MSASPKYTLYYYSGRGRGEVSRQILHFAGVEWEDVRFEHDEWLAKYKAMSPFGQCPWMEFDGHKVAQTHSICTYLANKYGLNAKTPEDQARLDAIALSIDNYVVWPASLARREKEEPKRTELSNKYNDELLPQACDNLNKALEMNNGGNGFFVGNEMTWVDMMFAHWCGWVPDGMGQELPFDKYPKLLALRQRVESHPKIAEWLKKRPVTPL